MRADRIQIKPAQKTVVRLQRPTRGNAITRHLVGPEVAALAVVDRGVHARGVNDVATATTPAAHCAALGAMAVTGTPPIDAGTAFTGNSSVRPLMGSFNSESKRCTRR